MRRLLTLVLVVLAVVVVPSRPAGACSCAAPDKPRQLETFEGRAIGEVLDGWLFDVERGDVGPRAVVDLDVDSPDMLWADSCSLGPAPVPGNRYRVVASSGRGGRLSAVLCGGGSLQLLELAPRDWKPPSTTTTSTSLPDAVVLLLAAAQAVGGPWGNTRNITWVAYARRRPSGSHSSMSTDA